ncbi:Malonyl-CoA O-methyltransferase BioC [Nocardia farcinica]|uniref:Malonyl-CoA O-methyltransferase BioC n=1 Tax=Nocardia farcinica TaxID=37329 RepID=A0A449H5J9_NOCFR|nr:class I SAM-dependent methyltransferase [Nocardia farcinica]VFA93302.1 Malonyl-CoA O-methyltransferase BioC [Nocardia farcinica]
MDTAAAYDAVAELYTDMARDVLAANPFERSALAVFAELVGDGPVADLGCGPGRLTGYLADAGLDVFGIDLSPRMIEIARAEYPALRFEVGSLERVGLPADALAGLLAWYSLIHLPPERVPAVLDEFFRVLRPGGHALLGFQAVDGEVDPVPYDHKVIRAFRWPPERLGAVARAAGFTVVARMLRAPLPDERGDQGYLLVKKEI